ncbi:MAG: AzlD domain-containing protein [Hyphomicrobiales bacterium]|nr:AzlD domain-containing protein [Hyphomicrobiales bacterium]
MDDTWIVIVGLAAATFSVRLGGVLLGARLPQTGPWARALQALPGSLIVALVTMLMLSAGPDGWLAGAISLGVAVATRNLPLTMLAGIAAIYVLRIYG